MILPSDEVTQHIGRTWGNVLSGNSTLGEKLEFGAEAATGVVAVAALGKFGLSRGLAGGAEASLPKLAIADSRAQFAITDSKVQMAVIGSNAEVASGAGVADTFGLSAISAGGTTAKGLDATKNYWQPLEDGMVRLYRGETYPTFAEKLLWKVKPGRTEFRDSNGAGLFYSPNLETARIYAARALKSTGTARILYMDVPKNKALDKYIFENRGAETNTLYRVARKMSEPERLQRTEDLLSGKFKHPEFTVPRRYRNSGSLVPDSVYQSVPPKVDNWSWIGNTWLGKRVLV